MFGFHLTRENGYSTLRVTGGVGGDDDRDTLSAALELVQHDERLILDLSDADHLDDAAAQRLHELFRQRTVGAESVVVSACEEISMQLVLHDVDRVCPIVPTADDAIAILSRAWTRRPSVR